MPTHLITGTTIRYPLPTFRSSGILFQPRHWPSFVNCSRECFLLGALGDSFRACRRRLSGGGHAIASTRNFRPPLALIVAGIGPVTKSSCVAHIYRDGLGGALCRGDTGVVRCRGRKRYHRRCRRGTAVEFRDERIIPVHLYGQPAIWRDHEICRAHGLVVVEDAASDRRQLRRASRRHTRSVWLFQFLPGEESWSRRRSGARRHR